MLVYSFAECDCKHDCSLDGLELNGSVLSVTYQYLADPDNLEWGHTFSTHELSRDSLQQVEIQIVTDADLPGSADPPQ